jgi:hypothetical protein
LATIALPMAGDGPVGSHCVQATAVTPAATSSAPGDIQRPTATGIMAKVPRPGRRHGGVSARPAASSSNAAAAVAARAASSGFLPCVLDPSEISSTQA